MRAITLCYIASCVAVCAGVVGAVTDRDWTRLLWIVTVLVWSTIAYWTQRLNVKLFGMMLDEGFRLPEPDELDKDSSS